MDKKFYVIGAKKLHVPNAFPGDMFFVKPADCIGIFPTAAFAVNAIINGTYNDTHCPVLAIVKDSENQFEETTEYIQMPFCNLKEVYTRHCDGVYHRESNYQNGMLSFPAE